MKCKNCKNCRKGWFESKPDSYVCIGVPEPYIINDIDVECPSYGNDRGESPTCLKDGFYINIDKIKNEKKQTIATLSVEEALSMLLKKALSME